MRGLTYVGNPLLHLRVGRDADKKLEFAIGRSKPEARY